MLGKILMVMMLIIMLIAGYVIYYNLPGEPIYLSHLDLKGEEGIISYGNTPVFWEDLRFANRKISYFIEPSCTLKREQAMLEAFSFFSAKTNAVSFYEASFQDAQIIVGCSKDYIDIGNNMFTAGEGGPSNVVNTSKYKIIQNGKILLFRETKCDTPVVELHELGHVFGFDHSSNPTNIMYNVSKCDQKITPDMIRIMQELYSVDSLPDLEITEISAVKRGRYLDFNITVYNNGLSKASGVKLNILSVEEVFETLDLEEMSIGFGRTIRAENILLPSRDIEKVYFRVDPKNLIEEIDEENNEVELLAN